jgi:hypothetical protein
MKICVARLQFQGKREKSIARWWCTPRMPALERLKQKDCEFEANLKKKKKGKQRKESTQCLAQRTV